MSDIYTIIAPLIHLAKTAGEQILIYYQKEIKVYYKENKTCLTDADLKAHDAIVSALSKLTPNIPLLSEESKNINREMRQSWQQHWLVDPLDGTREFINKTGEFCISLALIERHRPVFGLIYAPTQDICYYAYKGGGAFKQANGITRRIYAQSPKQSLRVVVGRHSSDNLLLIKHLQQIGEYQLFKMGSALKFAGIAEGRFDYYPKFGVCAEWDTAAGVCLVEQAGGSVLDYEQQPLVYNTKDSLLSPAFIARGAPNATERLSA